MTDNLSISSNGNARLTGKGIGNKTSVALPKQPKTSIGHVQILGKHQTNNNANTGKIIVLAEQFELDMAEEEAWKSDTKTLVGKARDTYNRAVLAFQTAFNTHPEVLKALKGMDEISKLNDPKKGWLVDKDKAREEFSNFVKDFKKIQNEDPIISKLDSEKIKAREAFSKAATRNIDLKDALDNLAKARKKYAKFKTADLAVEVAMLRATAKNIYTNHWTMR